MVSAPQLVTVVHPQYLTPPVTERDKTSGHMRPVHALSAKRSNAFQQTHLPPHTLATTSAFKRLAGGENKG